eukprot:scaffold25_cov190-Alexandrium_tamarense.AAC.13
MPFVCFCVEGGSNRGSRLVGSSVGGSGYVVWRTDSREWCAHNLKRYGISEKSTEQKPTQDDNKRQTSQLPNPDTTQWKAKSPLPMWQELQ